MYNPLVTIVIPVYNGEDYLSEAIDSALNQTYSPIEVLVISDGSTDGSERIAMHYGDKIRFIQKENGGVSSVLNMAIREMNGEWLSWLSHDDVYLPDKISAQMKKLNTLVEQGTDIEKIVLCAGNDRIDAQGETVKRKIKRGKQGNTPFETLMYQLENYTIGGCNVLAHRSAYEEMGGFNEANRTCSDAEMWYRLMLADYTFIFMDEVLVHSRQHGKMVSEVKKELCRKELEALHLKIVPEMALRLHSDSAFCHLGKILAKRSFWQASDLAYSYVKINSLKVKLMRKANDIKSSLFSVAYRTARSLYRKFF